MGWPFEALEKMQQIHGQKNCLQNDIDGIIFNEAVFALLIGSGVIQQSRWTILSTRCVGGTSFDTPQLLDGNSTCRFCCGSASLPDFESDRRFKKGMKFVWVKGSFHQLEFDLCFVLPVADAVSAPHGTKI